VQNLINRIRRLAADFRLAMCKLNEIQFDAPWAPRQSRCN
jgi:hypothetical protein